MDIGKYDTSISVSSMALQAHFDMECFCTTNEQKKLVYLALVADALKPIYFRKEKNATIEQLRTFGAHKSGVYQTFD